jgi:hypothetical protein
MWRGNYCRRNSSLNTYRKIYSYIVVRNTEEARSRRNVRVALDPPIRIEVQTCFETCTTAMRIVSKAGIRPSRASLESLILSDRCTRN